MWSRPADQAAALPEEGDLSEGGGGSTFAVPRYPPSSGPALPDPELPPRMEHWILVSGGFVDVFDMAEIGQYR